MNIVTTKVVFDGLYYWGSGWVNAEKADKWNEFWDSESAKGIFWTPFKKEEGFGITRYLVETGCAIYLHPMDFTVVLRKCGSAYRYNGDVKVEYYPEIDELKEIMKRCCEYCGCTFKIAGIKCHEISA